MSSFEGNNLFYVKKKRKHDIISPINYKIMSAPFLGFDSEAEESNFFSAITFDFKDKHKFLPFMGKTRSPLFPSISAPPNAPKKKKGKRRVKIGDGRRWKSKKRLLFHQTFSTTSNQSSQNHVLVNMSTNAESNIATSSPINIVRRGPHLNFTGVKKRLQLADITFGDNLFVKCQAAEYMTKEGKSVLYDHVVLQKVFVPKPDKPLPPGRDPIIEIKVPAANLPGLVEALRYILNEDEETKSAEAGVFSQTLE